MRNRTPQFPIRGYEVVRAYLELGDGGTHEVLAADAVVLFHFIQDQ